MLLFKQFANNLLWASHTQGVKLQNIIAYFVASIDYVIQVKRTAQGRIIDNVLDVKKDLYKILNHQG